MLALPFQQLQHGSEWTDICELEFLVEDLLPLAFFVYTQEAVLSGIAETAKQRVPFSLFEKSCLDDAQARGDATFERNEYTSRQETVDDYIVG